MIGHIHQQFYGISFSKIWQPQREFLCVARAQAVWGKSNYKQISPAKNFRAKPKQAGKKKGDLEEGIFARLLCRAKRDLRWEAVRPCVSKETKPAKIVSLIERFFLRAPSKKCVNFCGLCAARGDTEPLGGSISKILWIFLKESSDFIQYTEPLSNNKMNIFTSQT